MFIWLGAASSPSLPLETFNVSIPSSMPLHKAPAMTIQQGFGRAQNLEMKFIVTRAEVDRVTPNHERFHFIKNGMLKDVELDSLVAVQLAAVKPRYPPLSQLFDFGLLRQVVNEGR